MTDPTLAEWAESPAQQGEALSRMAANEPPSLLPDYRATDQPDHRRADLEAECRLAAYYLVLCQAHPCSSQVLPHHLSWPAIRNWWARALVVKTIHQPSDIGMPLSVAAELSDLHLSPSQVAATEQRVIKAAAARRLAHSLGEIRDHLAANGAEYLETALGDTRDAVDVSEAGLPGASKTQREVAEGVVKDWVAKLRDGDDASRIVPMIPQWQAAIGGWMRKKLHLIVARSSEHKTTLLRANVEHAARAGFECLGMILEDDAEDMASRTLAANVVGLTTRMLQTGTGPEQRHKDEHSFGRIMSQAWAATQEEYATRIRWVEDGAPPLSRVLQKLRAERAKRKIDLAYVDFGQLIQPDFGRADAQHWQLVTAKLQSVAKELDMALVVAVQIDKEATRLSQEEDNRPPRTVDALGGICWFTNCFGSICVAKKEIKGRPAIEWRVDKWKTGATSDGGMLWVTPERDRIDG